jgi:hypothetical protein
MVKKCTSALREVKQCLDQYYFLYINDLPLNIKEARIVLFADDTNFFSNGRKWAHPAAKDK